jgi:predicted phosphodiesterase
MTKHGCEFTFAAILATTTLAFGAAAQEPDFTLTHGPYLQQLTETSVMIVWTTNDRAISWVEYGTGENLGSFPTYGSVVQTAKSSSHGLVEAYTKLHRVLISGLEPGAQYRYRIFSKQILEFQPYEVTYGASTASGVHHFTTLDLERDSFSFVVLNDIHQDTTELDGMLRDLPWGEIDLVFYNGDLIDYYEDDSQLFDGFLDTSVRHFAREIPLILVRGNHETRGKNARRLMDFFPTRNGRFYYSFNQGSVHFIVLDSGEDKEDSHPVYAGLAEFDQYRQEQADWLRRDIETVASRTARFRVALFHIPPFGGRGHGATHVSETWNELLNEAGVDLVLNGHTHRFSRLDPEPGKNMYPILINGKDMLTRVDVTENRLKVMVTQLGGGIVDTFTIMAQGR